MRAHRADIAEWRPADARIMIRRHIYSRAMAHILVIGASKGIGLETVRQALETGHSVRALARSANGIGLADPRLEKVRGDALNAVDVVAALKGVSVVIQTLGIRFAEMFRPVHLFSDATRVLVDAMATTGVRRLICVTGFGAGASEANISLLQRIPFQLVFGRTYQDKSVQERLIKESALEWTIVRPGVLTGEKRTGRYRVLDQPSQWRNGVIGRADVADFLVRQIDSVASIRKEYVLVN
jgi:putative NADH-flavin reductase